MMIQLAGCAGLPTAAPPGPAAPTALPSTPPPLAITAMRNFVDAALAMQGEPYRYGGESPGGFDCSGLVAFAAKRAGIEIPRTAREQLQYGVPVTRAGLQPGDLVFMRLPNELHVGIVTAAGQFVHAPSTGGHVRIDPLDAQPYRDAFVAARRLQP